MAQTRAIYSCGIVPVTGQGLEMVPHDLGDLRATVDELLDDTRGAEAMRAALAGVPETEFESAALEAALRPLGTVSEWRVGESIAETYLTNYRGCSFPWPHGRDHRTPNASLPGADLVGFDKSVDNSRFVFGEVKTSSDKNSPPGVMTGRRGMTMQLEGLQTKVEVRRTLMRYLGVRAENASWRDDYRDASRRFLRDNSDVLLVGMLMRDVPPNIKDLQSRTEALAKNAQGSMTVELRALYVADGIMDRISAESNTRRART